MAKGMENLSSGHSVYKWLSAIGARQPAWFLGAIEGRANFGSWIGYLAKGPSNSDFLLKFQSLTDPWERSKLVGLRVSELRKLYSKLSREEKDELGRQSEAEFKTGIALLGKDKQTLLSLISITDPPVTE